MESPFPEPVPAGTRLIETFGWWPEEGARALALHLARMNRSAASLGFAFDPRAARRRIAELTGPGALRCRMTLGARGDIDLTTAPLSATGDRPWRVAIHPERLRAGDPWLAHKTTNRTLYDQARADLPEGVDEYLFLNDRGEICEGTITSLFVTLPDGTRVTPPLTSGLLPGVLREEMLENGAIVERIVTPEMLKGSVISLGNSLRGEIQAQLLI